MSHVHEEPFRRETTFEFLRELPVVINEQQATATTGSQWEFSEMRVVVDLSIHLFTQLAAIIPAKRSGRLVSLKGLALGIHFR